MKLEHEKTVSAGGADAPASSGEEDENIPAGTTVGEYVIDKKLGEGGFGAVYRATHPLIGKTAAVKVLNRAFSANAQIVARFVSEARAVNQIRHRNIVDIFAFGALPDGRQYYVMELLEGETFDGHIERVGRMTIASAMPVFRAVGRALDAAHAQGIVHRDLKPENVFLVHMDDGTVFPKLLDFGIAKLMKDEGGPQQKTRTGMQIGTPYYMSPEQCRGVGVDHRSDIYAFGVMIHRVLSGHLLFDGESMMDIMMKHVATPPPVLSSVAPDLPQALDAPISRMLSKNPAERPSTIGEALDAIEAAARGAGVDLAKSGMSMAQTPAPGMPQTPLPSTMVRTDLSMGSVEPRPKSRGALFAGLGVVALLAIGGGVFLLRGTEKTSANKTDEKTEKTETTASKKAETTTAASVTTPPPASTTAAPSAAVEKTVSVTFEVKPVAAAAAAEVWLGETKLGMTPGPLAVPYSKLPLSLKVVAPGYAPKMVEVTPSADETIKVALVPGQAPPPTTSIKKPISKDLESPF